MKKLLSFLAVVLISTAVFAQSVTLTFTAKDAANQHVQLNRVAITNLTKGWQETIYWPDTTLTMQNGTGINDVETHGRASLQLSQNNPNPFTGTTEVSMMVAEEDEVMLDIADVNGKIVGSHRMRPQAGTHQFRVTLSTAGTYVMTARQNGQTSSIKMVCNGGGDGNRIEYTGVVETHGRASLPSSQPKNGPKYTTTRPFNFGDQMEYVGYATINGSEAESQRIMQAQGASQTFTLQFAETQTQVQLPTVTTSAVSNITSSSATAGGTVISDGGATVFDRGVCYSTASMPTVSDNCIHIGQGTGAFSGNITGLNDNTTYYVRAYAMSNAGIAYGNEVSFTTTSTAAITVTTDPVTGISSNEATCGGTVIYDGEENIMVRGVCWNTSPNPTANHSHTTDGSGVGHFTSQLTGLTLSTTYYVRAYATSVLGTVYGNEVCFTTGVDGLPCPDAATVTDIDGNTYNTVLLGNQCWMKENLRTTRYANGITIPLGTSTSTTTPYRYNPNDNASNVPTYGYLYNWPAVMQGAYSSSSNPSGVQGICPNGWHVPSKAEWTQLTNYVGSQTQYQCNNSSVNIAKALASTTGWDNSSSTCAVGNNPSTNNATGFAALPAGDYHYGYYGYFGVSAQFGSATDISDDDAYHLFLYYNYANVGISDDYKYDGFSVRCVKGVGTTSLAVLTDTVTSITSNSATCGGEVISDGGSMVIARGVCWSTSQNPTISDSHTTNGTGTGSFTSNITGLAPLTTYYVRAYATNSNGTAYGEQLNFTTYAAIPTVTTNVLSNITSNSVTCGGYVTAAGAATVTTRGVCWSTSQNPTVNDSHTTDGSGTGNFTSSIIGLTPTVKYYVRAYATNSVGTGYGDELYFTTPGAYDGQPCPGAATVTDYDNNTYNTVMIGTQCWMKENLRTTHYSNGTSIPLGTSASTTTPYRYNPNDNASNVPTYGYLYNWPAVLHGASSSSSNPSGVQGICPTGWHVPSDAEWTQLTDYLRSQSQYVCNNNSNGIAKALASTTGWNSSTTACAVGNNQSSNNATGFSALPAGMFVPTSIVILNTFGEEAIFWSATVFEDDHAFFYRLGYANAGVSHGASYEYYSLSVRCVKDAGSTVTVPTVTTTSVTSVAATSATCGGNVTSDGGATITTRGVCWSTSQNPTVNDSHTTNGSGTGSFTSSITGLTAGSTYYVRAYATNNFGIGYGNQISFIAASSVIIQEGFDNATVPTGWTAIDADGDGHNWGEAGDLYQGFAGHTGLGISSASYISNVGALTPDNWLITPAISLTNNSTLTFWVAAQDVDWAAEHYGVYISTTGTSTSNFTLLFEEDMDANGGSRTQGLWKQKTVSLSAYTGQTVYIAFRHFGCTDQYWLDLDDVKIVH